MLVRDQALRTERTAGPKRRATGGRVGVHVARRRSLDRGSVVRILTLGLVLLAASCVRFTYDETRTAIPDATPSPAPTTVAASATPRDASLDETLVPVPTISGPTVLRTDPSIVNLAVGETGLVQVWLDNVEGLHSIELHIGFEPRTVCIEDADPDAAGVQIGAGVLPMPAQVLQNEADNDAGRIVYQVAQAPASPASGSGMVASFTARALAEGGSPLRFSAVELFGPDGQSLPTPEQVDGLIVVGAGGAVPEPTATPRPAAPASPVPTEDVYHTVQPGENLFRIALRYGTTVEAIVAANHLPDQSSVQAGQELLIPVGPSAGKTTYVVQPGDTLYSIACRFDTTVETLAALNGIGPSHTIAIGQVLIVAP
jgi:LysM repeat protein